MPNYVTGIGMKGMRKKEDKILINQWHENFQFVRSDILIWFFSETAITLFYYDASIYIYISSGEAG